MINNVAFQGRLTKDPEVRITQSGVPVLGFTVAWSEKFKESETKCFLPCQAWRATADFIGKYFKKGSQIIVEGNLETNEWTDNEGNNKSIIRLNVQKAHFCGAKGEKKENQSVETVATTASIDGMVVASDEPLPF